MAVYTEEIELKDGISRPAMSAADKVKVLTEAINSTQKALFKAQSSGNIGQYKKLSAEVTAYKASLSTLPPVLEAVHAPSVKVSSGLKGTATELSSMINIYKDVAKAALAVGEAIGSGVISIVGFAIEAVEARAKMTALFDALGEGRISGRATVDMMDALGDSIGQTRAQLAPTVQTFLTMGITGKDQLTSLTKAAASAGAIAEGGAEKFATLFAVANAAAETGAKFTMPFKKLEKQLRGVGLNIGDLAVKMKMSEKDLTRGLKAGTIDASNFATALTDAASAKGAGALAQQGRSLTNVWGKFQENIMKLFESIDVGPFLDQVKDLFDIFGQGKASGQALTSGIGGFFKQVFTLATKVVPYIRHFLLDLVIYGLKAYISLRPIAKWFLDLRNNAKVMNIVTQAFKGIAIAIGAVLVVVGLAIGLFVALTAAAGIVAISIWAALATVVEFVDKVVSVLGGLVTSALQLGKDFVAGIVGGITSGASAVVDAVKGLADGAKNTFKNILKIHSPSKVMMEMGTNVGQGAAAGIDASIPAVHDSSASLGKAVAGGAAGGAAGGSGGGKGGGVTINVEPGAIVIEGGGKDAANLTEEALALLFERIALMEGL